MTTVVTDGVTLACDSQISDGNGMVSPNFCKMYYAEGVGAVAMFGAVAGYDEGALYMLRKAALPGFGGDRPTEEDWAGLLLCEDGRMYRAGGKETMHRVFGQQYGGTGGPLAVALLGYLGPFNAVERACELDLYSGGPIHDFRRGEPVPPVCHHVNLETGEITYHV